MTAEDPVRGAPFVPDEAYDVIIVVDAATTRILQRGLKIRKQDLGAYLAKAQFDDVTMDVEGYFLTPGGMIWVNGRDGKTWFNQAFSVYKTERGAFKAATTRAGSAHTLTLYRTDFLPSKQAIALTVVSRAERET